jgi:hypothetical protein
MNEYMVNSSTVVDGYPAESADSVVRINDYFTFSTVSGAVLASIIVPFLYQIIYYRFFHPLKDYPGPFWGSVTRIWHTLENIKGTELETYQRLLEEKKSIQSATSTVIS